MPSESDFLRNRQNSTGANLKNSCAGSLAKDFGQIGRSANASSTEWPLFREGTRVAVVGISEQNAEKTNWLVLIDISLVISYKSPLFDELARSHPI